MSDTGVARLTVEVTLNTIRRRIGLLAATVTIMLLSACTPIQLSTYENMTGADFTDNEVTLLLALPDKPMRLTDGRIILPDGTVTADPAGYVNSLGYSYKAKAPVIEAFRVVTASRGWTSAQTASWEPALWDIVSKESQACWNVRYGAKFAYYDGRGCILRYGGTGAAGFGQLTSVILHVPCARVGICTGSQVVASPWNSMLALVTVIEAQGVGPWCYSSWARSYHAGACYHPGYDVP